MTHVYKAGACAFRLKLILSRHTHLNSPPRSTKRSIFQYKDTIPNHFGQTNTHIIFRISSSIVEKIIGDMFFNPGDHGGITQERALNLFTSNADCDGYTVTIKNLLQFHLIVGYLIKRLSFRQVKAVFLTIKQLTDMTSLRNC
jgi:hypothetical protein